MKSAEETIRTDESKSKPEVYYDSGKAIYWVNGKQGIWIPNYSGDVSRRLKKAGLRAKPEGNRIISEIEEAIIEIQDTREVSWVGPLAGYKTGVYDIHGRRILVQDSPSLITPTVGEFCTIEKLLDNMLPNGQRLYFDGWLKVAVESLFSFSHRVGQALVLAGPVNSGKSLVQSLITQALGGRAGDPYRSMTGNQFNGELFGCEHLMIEDKIISTKISDRLAFGAKIKEITANINQAAHTKFRQALTLTPFWRLSISVNSETENLLILPPLNDHIIDKMIILKVEQHPMPMPTGSNAERELFWRILTRELPHYLFYLINEAAIANRYASERYGITHYHHPDIVEALRELTPEFQLLELIQAAQLYKYQGKAKHLEELLTNHAGVSAQARKLLTWSGACATYLARLAKERPDSITPRHTLEGNVWIINLPRPTRDEGNEG